MLTELLTSERVRDSTRFVARELVREPVKAAVKDALREEAAAVETTGDTDREDPTEQTGSAETDADESGDSGGRSGLFWAAVIVSAAGVLYVARQRMQSSWSRTAGPQDSGYATEGELQTEESGHGEEGVSHGDRSPATEG